MDTNGNLNYNGNPYEVTPLTNVSSTGSGNNSETTMSGSNNMNNSNNASGSNNMNNNANNTNNSNNTSNSSNVSSNSNLNDVSHLNDVNSGANSSANTSNNSNNTNKTLENLLNEIKNIGEELAGSSRAQSQPQEQNNSEQSLSSNIGTNSAATNGTSTANGGNDSNYSISDVDNFEIEREIVRQVQLIRMNANKYGEVVDVVGRRAVLARSSNGRGNGYQFEYLLSDGRIVSNDQAWELANAGKLRNIISSHNRGRKYIRRVGDGISDNNLGNLPPF